MIALTGAVLCGAPAIAQQTATPATSTAQPSADTVGPAQLKDFSLNGTVTRRAADTPAPSAPTTSGPRPATRTAETTTPAQAEPSAPTPQRREARAPTATATQPSQPAAEPQQRVAAQRDPFDFAPPTPGTNGGAGFAPATVAPQPAAAPFDTYTPSTDESGGLLKWLPWIAALIAAAGAALWYLRRQRSSGYAFAGAGADASAFDMGPTPTPPRPAPVPRAPVPAPPPAAPPAAAPVGIVSTRLRPTLEIEFVPQRAVINDDGATIEFEIGVFNSGSAPARDVLVEAALFNAGPEQDESIGAFFARPTAKGEPIPALPPLQRLTFNHAVAMTREQMRLFSVEDRSVFVPVIGFNALFKWSGGDGQTSTSYIVGRDGNGDKLAPFRADLGARVFRDVGAREHSLTVRK